MEYEEIKAWLDWQVNNIKERECMSEFNGQIMVQEPDKIILVHKGIEILADVAGAELRVERQDHKWLPYVWQFEYRGIIFRTYKKEGKPDA